MIVTMTMSDNVTVVWQYDYHVMLTLILVPKIENIKKMKRY